MNNKVIKRQYSLGFKKKAVKTVKGLRDQGIHGSIKAFCSMIDVHPTVVNRWVRQSDAGILKRRNAIAFSSNPKAMVRE